MTAYTVTLDGNDITADVRNVWIQVGGMTLLQRVARVGACRLTLNNVGRTYSPANASSPLYGSLLPYKAVVVTVDSTPVFTGVVETIRPDAGLGMNSEQCTIECMDLLGVLQSYLISLPLQTGHQAGYLLKLITSAALRAPRATGTLTFATVPGAGDVVTIDTTTYTFQVTPADPYEVALGSSANDAADHLQAAIHTAGAEYGTGLYGANTVKHPTVTAEVAAAAGAGGGTTTIAGTQTTYLSVGKLAGTDSRIAQRFQPVTGQLDELHLPMHLGPGTDSVAVTWEVCEEAAGVPGNVLATGTFAPATGTVDITGIAGPILSSTQGYWLVLRKVGVAGSEDYTYWEAEYDAGGVTPPTAATKFGGGAWIVSDYYRMPATSIVTVAVSGATMTLTAVARGAWANSIPVTSGVTLLTNGDFANGETDWQFYSDGTITHSVTDGKLSVYRSGGTWAAFYQVLTGQAVSIGDTVTLKWKVANTSGVAKTYWAVVTESGDYTEQLAQQYNLAANTAEATYSWTKVATGAWADTRIDFSGFDDDNTPALVFDGLELYINNVIVSASYTLTGGADKPDTLDFDDGIRTIDVAGDTWSDAHTNALSAIQDVIDTEFGYFWVTRAGVPTFRDQQFPFLLGAVASSLTLNNTHTLHDTALSVNDIINRVSVSWVPRGTNASGVVARAQATLAVPGRGEIDKSSTNYSRWNPSDDITQDAGSRTFTIPYVDVGTGKVVGAESLVLPLVPGTDYTIYDTQDTSGHDYTYDPYVKFSLSLTGYGVEVHLTNTALGTLYVQGFQVRGVALIAYDAVNVVIDESTSQDDYGRRGADVALPLPVTGGDAYAEALARYVLQEYAQPVNRVLQVGLEGIEAVGGTSVYDLDIGQIVTISESQTATAGFLAWITGIAYTLDRQALPLTLFQLQRLTGQAYWLLGEAGYSELGETTWLGL